MTAFPANPKDGTIFEVRRGLYFIYEAATKSWIRVAGAGQIFPLATPISAGLMAAADLQKINRIVIPMPEATITGENCNSRFISGHISLYSTDDFLRVTGEPTIKNTNASYPFRITRNTAGFDFTIDKQALVDELIKRGQINLVGPTGARGQRGNKGASGGVLPTGPKGPKGDKGTSPPCTFTIVPDPAPAQIKEGTNKAIVGLRTERVSDTEFDLIIERGVVGNPDASPSKIMNGCTDSTWVLAVPTSSGAAQTVYYIDLSSIISTIQEKFASEIQRLKEGHEEVVQFWLNKMAELFYAQKASLCCALTACMQTKAAEAQPVTIDGVVATQEQTASILPAASQHFSNQHFDEQHLNRQQDNKTSMTVNGLLHLTRKRAATIDLPAGRYDVRISECCIKAGDNYVGDVVIIYRGRSGEKTTQFMHPTKEQIGKFSDHSQASGHYINLNIIIDHDGGPVLAYYPASFLHETSGKITLEFKKLPDNDFVVAGTQTCLIGTEKLSDYEYAWMTSNCCGFITRIAGQDYIIVNRSAAGDGYCGSDGDIESDCFTKFGTLAIAWPTIDGKTFVHLSGRSFRFGLIDELIGQVTSNLTSGAYWSVRGQLPKQPLIVLFPLLD